MDKWHVRLLFSGILCSLASCSLHVSDWAVGWTIQGLNPGGDKRFFLQHVQTGSEAHPASRLMGDGDAFPEGKAARHETNHSQTI